MSEVKRCPTCNWPLADRMEDGCVEGNCSQRPPPKRARTISDCAFRVRPEDYRKLVVENERLNKALEYEVEEKEKAEDVAGKMANEIADYFGVDVGEHSNLNNPWTNARRILMEAKRPPRTTHTRGVDHG